MNQTRERRRRTAKRPLAYLVILVVAASAALGSAWQAARPAGQAHGKSQDAGAAAP